MGRIIETPDNISEGNGPHMAGFLSKSYKTPATEIFIGSIIFIFGIVFLALGLGNKTDTMIYIGAGSLGVGCLSLFIGLIYCCKSPPDGDMERLPAAIPRHVAAPSRENTPSPKKQQKNTESVNLVTELKKSGNGSQSTRTRAVGVDSPRRQKRLKDEKRDSVRSTHSAKGGQSSRADSSSPLTSPNHATNQNQRESPSEVRKNGGEGNVKNPKRDERVKKSGNDENSAEPLLSRENRGGNIKNGAVDA